MYSQNALTNFETKAQTFINDSSMPNDVELLRKQYLKTTPAFMHLERGVLLLFEKSSKNNLELVIIKVTRKLKTANF